MFVHSALIAAGIAIGTPGPVPCFDIPKCDGLAYYPYSAALRQQPDTGKKDPKHKPAESHPKPAKPSQPPPEVHKPAPPPHRPAAKNPPPPAPKEQPELRRRKPN